jgi:hypothetical protein
MGGNEITSGSQRIRVNVHQPANVSDTALEENLYAGNPPAARSGGTGEGLRWLIGGAILGAGGALLVSSLLNSNKNKNRDRDNFHPQFPMPYPPDQTCYNQQPYYDQSMSTNVNYTNQQPQYYDNSSDWSRYPQYNSGCAGDDDFGGSWHNSGRGNWRGNDGWGHGGRGQEHWGRRWNRDSWDV